MIELFVQLNFLTLFNQKFLQKNLFIDDSGGIALEQSGKEERGIMFSLKLGGKEKESFRLFILDLNLGLDEGV